MLEKIVGISADIKAAISDLEEGHDMVSRLNDIVSRLDNEISLRGPLRGALTEETKISGQRFEEFYRNTFPAGWMLEDLPYEASDDRDVWVMDPDREEPFSWFGYAIRVSDTDEAGPRLAELEALTDKNESAPLSVLYQAITDDALEAEAGAAAPAQTLRSRLEDWRSREDAVVSDDPLLDPVDVNVEVSGPAVDVFIGGAKDDPYGVNAASVRIEREGAMTRVMVYDGLCEAPRVIGVPKGCSSMELPSDWEPMPPQDLSQVDEDTLTP